MSVFRYNYSGSLKSPSRARFLRLAFMSFLALTILVTSGTAAFWLGSQSRHFGPITDTSKIGFSKASFREFLFTNNGSAADEEPNSTGAEPDSTLLLVALLSWPFMQMRAEQARFVTFDPLHKIRPLRGQPANPRAPPTLD